MKRDTDDSVLLPSLIPDAAYIPSVQLGSEAKHLAGVLSNLLAIPDCEPLDLLLFLTRAFSAFCQDGTPAGLALRSPAGHVLHRSGQFRKLQDGFIQARQAIERPLVCEALERIVCYTLHVDDLASTYPIVADLLERLATTLDKLAEQQEWRILRELPPPATNRVFDLHCQAAGYPAYRYLAGPLHFGLIAAIKYFQQATPEKQIHNQRAYTTGVRALLPVLKDEGLASALSSLPDDDTAIRGILDDAVWAYTGTDRKTRSRWVSSFLDLLKRGFENRGYVSRTGHRRRRRMYTTAELDPEADPPNIPQHTDWQEACARDARAIDAPTLIGIALTESQEGEEGEETEAARVHRPWYRDGHRVLELHPSPAMPAVFQVYEMAELYAATLQGNRGDSLAERLDRASRFLLLDLLLHTGRPPEWLAALTLGERPTPAAILPAPLLDPDGCIWHTPPKRIGIPKRLREEGEAGERARREHRQAYDPMTDCVPVPLTSRQRAYVRNYCTLRAKALAHGALPAQAGLDADKEAGPLLLVADEGRLRGWNEADTKRFLQELTAFMRSRHPGWLAVRAARFCLTFQAHYSTLGLDPVYAFYISGHYRPELEMPLIYSRVWAGDMAEAYEQVQQALRLQIEGDYKRIAPDATDRDPLLWSFNRPLPPLHLDDLTFGSWHHPLTANLQAILRGLEKLADSPDRETAHNAQMAYLALGLTCTTGMRPAEVCALLQRWVDLAANVIAVDGKSNYAWSANRLVPISEPLRRPLRWAQDQNGPKPAGNKSERYLLWLFEDGVPTAATVEALDGWLMEGGYRGGLRDEEIPDWYSARHLFRSRALKQHLPYPVVNALMGHQVGGSELYHPLLEQDPLATLNAGRELARLIAAELGWDVGLFAGGSDAD